MDTRLKTGYSSDISAILAAARTSSVENTSSQSTNNDINEILNFAQGINTEEEKEDEQRPITPGINQIDNQVKQNVILQPAIQSQPAGSQKFLEISTDQALVFKCLAKLLLKNFTDSTILIMESGMYLSESTEEGSVLIECFLNSQQFLSFNIPKFEDPSSTISLGFSTKDFLQATEGITKTDDIKMFILAHNTNMLCLEITNAAKKKKSQKFISLKKTTLGNLTSPSYTDHKPTATILASQFKRAIVDAKKVSKQMVRIRAQEHGAVMESAASQIGGFKESWGDWREGLPAIYDECITTARLHAIAELAQITRTIRIYCCSDDRPLKISANAGDLGTICIYLDGLSKE